jgi:hypothetical protein
VSSYLSSGIELLGLLAGSTQYNVEAEAKLPVTKKRKTAATVAAKHLDPIIHSFIWWLAAAS